MRLALLVLAALVAAGCAASPPAPPETGAPQAAPPTTTPAPAPEPAPPEWRDVEIRVRTLRGGHVTFWVGVVGEGTGDGGYCPETAIMHFDEYAGSKTWPCRTYHDGRPATVEARWCDRAGNGDTRRFGVDWQDDAATVLGFRVERHGDVTATEGSHARPIPTPWEDPRYDDDREVACRP